MKQKKIIFFAKKFQNGRLKKTDNWVFQPPLKAERLPPKFHGLVLGLVEMIDAKGIAVAQSIS